MQCYGVRLVARSVGGEEVKGGGGEEAGSDIASMWNCIVYVS